MAQILTNYRRAEREAVLLTDKLQRGEHLVTCGDKLAFALLRMLELDECTLTVTGVYTLLEVQYHDLLLVQIWQLNERAVVNLLSVFPFVVKPELSKVFYRHPCRYFEQMNRIGVLRKSVKRPVNLFVAKFLGSPAINVFDGEIKGGKLLIDGEVFDDDPVYKNEYHGKIERERQVVKGTELSLEDYLADLEAHPERLEGLDAKAVHALQNPELEVLHYYEEVVKQDRIVKIGVRPEAFTLVTAKKGSHGIVPVDVDYVQRVGRDISMIGKVHGQENSNLKIIIPTENWDDVKGKENVNFTPKRYYVFEESGERIK